MQHISPFPTFFFSLLFLLSSPHSAQIAIGYYPTLISARRYLTLSPCDKTPGASAFLPVGNLIDSFFFYFVFAPRPFVLTACCSSLSPRCRNLAKKQRLSSGSTVDGNKLMFGQFPFYCPAP